MRVLRIGAAFLSVTSVLVFAQRGAPGAPSGTGAVAGRVVDAVSGESIGDASVSLSGDDRRPQRTVQAAADGRWEFRDIAAGNLLISARKAGYAGGFFGNRTPSDIEQWFDVRDDEQARDVVLRLWKAASVSGRVTDAGNHPIYRATVRAYSVRDVDGRSQWLPSGRDATTEMDGTYHLADLRPGRFVVSLVSVPTDFPGGPSGSALAGAAQRTYGYPVVFYPSAFSPRGASTLTLATGEDRGFIDFQQTAQPMVVVSGEIRGLASTPTRPTQAVLIPGDVGDILPIVEVTRTSVAPDGQFAFPSVLPGHYVIRVAEFPLGTPRPQSPGGVTGILQSVRGDTSSFTLVGGGPGRDIVLAPMTTAPTAWLDEPITVVGTDLEKLAFTAKVGAHIGGHIVFDGSGDLLDSSLLPRALAIVQTADGRSLDFFQAARFESDGQFTTIGLPAGRYRLIAFPSVPGSGVQAWDPTWNVGSISRLGRDLMGEPIVLGLEDVSDIVITMTNRLAELSGAVRDAGGQLRSDATVYIFSADRQSWTGDMPVQMFQRRATRLGQYRQRPLKPGPYFVAALVETAPPDTWRDPAFIASLVRGAITVTLGKGEKQVRDLTVR
jgi:hypothetical protein